VGVLEAGKRIQEGVWGKPGTMKTVGGELRMGGRVPINGVTEEFEVREE